MSQTHLQQVLTAAGLPEDQVKALVDLKDDAPDFKPDTFVAPVHTAVETNLKNDSKFFEGITKEQLTTHNPALLKTLESEQYGRSASIVRSNLLKAVALTEKDFADLGDEGKKIEVFTPALIKKITEGKITDKELQTKLMEATDEITALKAATPELEKKYKAEADQALNERSFDLIVLSLLAQVPGLKAPALVAPGVIQQLKAKYGYAVQGLTAELRQKDKPDLKVLVNNKELSLLDAVKDLVKDAVVAPAKGEPDKGTVKVSLTGEKGELKLNGHVSKKVQAVLDAEQKNGK